MYLYLSREEAFEVLPKPLFERFGRPELVMRLELHPGRKLAREDVSQVLQNLQNKGFHLQLPPDIKPDLYQGD
jgi:uncharacterized protein YcgL (UPF0745 family)